MSAITKVWMLGQVVVAPGDGAEATINQIQDYRPDPGFEVALHTGDGKVDFDFAAIMRQAPRLGFTTTAIARALTVSGLSAYSMAAGMDFYFQRIAHGGTRTGSSTSQKLTAAKGILVPTSIDATDGAIAAINYESAVTSADGTTAPLTIGTGATLPAHTATDQVYTVGPASINGTAIEGVQSIRISFGLQLIVKGGDGHAYPTFAGIVRRQPTISIRSHDLSYLASSSYYAAQGSTDSLVYLRKVAKNGIRVADATAEHLKFSVDDGLVTVRPFGGQDGAEQMTEFLIQPTFDGTNDVIAINTASAIA
jgi:hypothetical protein